MSEKLLFRYYLRLKTEGFLKALLWGLAVGFGALAVFGVLHWVMGWKFAWVCALVGVTFAAVSTYVFYQWKFKPTTKYIARRVDDLGLHERILTMTELEGDESYIAKLQRKDALESLSLIREDLLTIGVSIPSIVAAFVAMVLGVFGALLASGVFSDFNELNPVIPTAYEIKYEVLEGEGTIVGELTQTVASGEMTEGVIAVPADGWRFLKWTDGEGIPYRSDEVVGKQTYYAVFVQVKFAELTGLGDDIPYDAPGDQEENGQNSQQQPPQDQEQDPQAREEKYEAVNQVIDGETYYGDIYDEMYSEAFEKLMDDKYTEDQKNISNGYFENIEKGNQDEEEQEQEDNN